MAERPAQLAEGVWRIRTPLPFRPRSVHAYLVALEGGRWLLVDGGANTDEAWAALDDAVRRVAGGWRALALHAVTHMHVDHVGLVRRVRGAGGAPLAMGRLDAERAAHAHAHPEEEAEYRERLLRENGAPEEVLRSVQGARERANPLSAFVPADHLLAADTAPLAGAPGWLSVWTPGHTAGHVSLFRPADRLLLAGDAILPGTTPTLGVNRQREDPVGDYLAALDRLAALRPALALCGHGEPLAGPAARIAELRAEAEAEADRVAALLGPEPASAWDLARARYAGRELPASVQMLALRETRAHLDRLAARGRARRTEHGGVVEFAG